MTRRVTWIYAACGQQRGSISAVKTILDRKVTPMLPEPTLPKPSAAAPALAQPWVMTPLFCVPDGEPDVVPSPGRRGARPPGRPARPANLGAPAGRAKRAGKSAESGPRKDAPDLLAVTAQRLRQALARSFLRYGVSGDPDTAVHAAMNVIEPVLEARDTEILRLRRLMSARIPRR
jgi:hypothetical protein